MPILFCTDHRMLRKILSLGLLLIYQTNAFAQQFIGNSLSEYTAVQMVPSNPAWVCNSETGVEIYAFGYSAMAGTNAYLFDKNWVLGGYRGQAIEGKDYIRDSRIGIKHIWANAEVLGPAFTLAHNHKHYVGMYTRYRQIVRGGGISSSEMPLIGDLNNPLYYEHPITIENAGFTVHSFGELGFTYGRVLRDDDYHFFKAGATIKYLFGFAAASVYTNSLTYERKNSDTLAQLRGDLTTAYTYNLSPFVDYDAANDRSNWFDRAGRGGLGLDLGVQYQYHPDGNPNYRTQYLFSLAASLTDFGSVKYIADSGSAVYRARSGARHIDNLNKRPNEDAALYFRRQVRDTLLQVEDAYGTFRVSLPTALRLNADWNVYPRFNMAVNMLLNLKGNNGKIYNPGYVGYLNVTPSYGIKNVRVGIPFTFTRRQTIALGMLFRLGPIYAGSNTLISSVIMTKSRIRNIDGFIGLSFKISKPDDFYRYR